MEIRTSGHSRGVNAAQHLPPQTEPSDFEAIYEEHAAGVWRLLQRLGVPESGLEDAVQEVFLIAHRRLPGFRGDSTLKTWLGGIAIRVAKDVRRSFSRKGGREEPLKEDSRPLEVPPSMEESLGHREELTRVLLLLEQLGEELRTIFVCAEFEGMTAPEISAATGVNLNTVYARLRTARLRFNALATQTGEAR
jgi:RNA polymerase sigma-70 factor (ECF subfamily)